MKQSCHTPSPLAMASLRIGNPTSAIRGGSPLNLSPPFLAKDLHTAAPFLPMKLIANDLLASIASKVPEARSKQIRNIGGASDNGVTALMVKPTGAPAALREVTIATPVSHCPAMLRKASPSIRPGARSCLRTVPTLPV